MGCSGATHGSSGNSYVPGAGRLEAEDVIQDTYLRLLQRADLDTIRNARAFLYQTASHLLTDRARRARGRDLRNAPGVDPDTLCSAAPELDRALESAWQLEDLLSALEDLPAIGRHAFLLNKIDGLTHPEIAERFGISQKKG